jgi:PST family polysaccharide transporter
MGISALSIKVTAIYLGPPGLALVGQLSNFITLVQGGVGNAIQTGVTKLTAGNEGDPERQRHVWRTGFLMAFGLVSLSAAAVIVLARPISAWLFDSPDYWPVMVVAGPCIVLATLGILFMAILAGLKRIREQAYIGIFSTVFGAALFIPLAYRFGIWGGLVGTALAASGGFLGGWFVSARMRPTGTPHMRGHWNTEIAREITRYYPMLLANSAVPPLALILVRNVIGESLGAHSAGIWQAVWRISDMYLLVITTAVSFYLMPHLSSVRGDAAFARELFSTTVKITGLTAIAAASVYLARDVIIFILFTDEFRPIRELVAWQLTGDVLKLAGWPLTMALVIRLRTAWYIALMTVPPLLHAALTYVLSPSMHGNAATIGYALAYLFADLLLLVASREYVTAWLYPSGKG